MRIKLGFILIAFAIAIAAVGMASIATAQPDLSAGLCHRTGSEWRFIWVNNRALQTHLDHGDVFLGHTWPGWDACDYLNEEP